MSASAKASPTDFNVGSFLRETAIAHPRLTAIRAATGRHATPWEEIDYFGLDSRSDGYARGLMDRGLARGDRTCVFVRPGIDLVAVTYALFKLGAVPVLIDPGMGLRNVLACVAKIRPRAFVAVPRAFAVRTLFRRAFATVELEVVCGPRRVLGRPTLSQIARQDSAPLPLAETRSTDEAAILFTSGSTGPPKGVVYTHGTFEAQVRALRSMYGFAAGETDVACFPLFALFDTAFATTCVFPELDPSRPGSCDPARIVAALQEHRATTSFASPAVWRRVVPWCLERGITLPHLRRVTTAGAPIPPRLVEEFMQILPSDAVIHTPYGATESLPVASITGKEILGPARVHSESGAGTCVGRPAPIAEVAVIRIIDAPIETWHEDLRVPAGELGELCVAGPAVTREYKFDETHTRASKIRDGERLWHRMGDLGYTDTEGRIWFCGRKAHRLETAAGTVPAVPAENVFNTHPDVLRTALVGIGPRGTERPVLVVEPRDRALTGRSTRSQALALARELVALGATHEASACVTDPKDVLLFKGSFPVDVRHNAKIDRPALARWAARRHA